MNSFNILSEEQIQSGEATDAYFLRTEEAMEEKDHNPSVVAEITADQFGDGEFEVFAGLNEALNILENLDVDVEALPEGTLFDGGPVMKIYGNYLEFARYETAILGVLSHASGIATAALEATAATYDDGVQQEASVLSFGSRHVHPALGELVERSALIGGVNGFSNVAAGKNLGLGASGTMPHALMLSFGRGNQEDAWEGFAEGKPDDTPLIVLCDTFTDETDEVRRAVEQFGDDLDGIRLDTTGSRRGDFKHIIKEVKWTLNELDAQDVDIYVSGGLGPDDIQELRQYVDGFGVGSHISNADPVDFSLDIVEVDGNPISKRGKLSQSKNVYRNKDGEHVVTSQELPGEQLLTPVEKLQNVEDEKSTIERASERAMKDALQVGFRNLPRRQNKQ